MRKYRIFALLAVTLFSGSSFGAARIKVETQYVYFDTDSGGAAEQVVEVANLSATEPAYVAHEIYRFSNGVSEKAPVGKDALLMVWPRKQVIPPGKVGYIRIRNPSGFGEKERTYYVRSTPIEPPKEFAMSELESKKSLGFSLSIAYDVMVLVQPSKPRFSIEISRMNESTIVLRNSGNGNFRFERLQACRGESDCVDLMQELKGSIRLFPGGSVNLPLKNSEYKLKGVVRFGRNLQSFEG